METTITTIEGINQYFKQDSIHPKPIICLLELKDKRIASSSIDGSISICTLDYVSKTITQDILHTKAHDKQIYSICELPDNRLVSCSEDHTIKIWSIHQSHLSLIQTLTIHIDNVYKVSPLINENNSISRFVSCSDDRSIKIWNADEPYDLIHSINAEENVYTFIQLKKKKETLVASCGLRSVLKFYDCTTYALKATFPVECTRNPNSLIELPNGMIAISNIGNIIVIDPIMFVIVKELKDEELTEWMHPLCVLGKESFVYGLKGSLIQLLIEEKFEVFHQRKIMWYYTIGEDAMITADGGKYIVANNENFGISVLTYCSK